MEMMTTPLISAPPPPPDCIDSREEGVRADLSYCWLTAMAPHALVLVLGWNTNLSSQKRKTHREDDDDDDDDDADADASNTTTRHAPSLPLMRAGSGLRDEQQRLRP
jgi:hypothetical protein